jgi:WAS family protein
MSTITSPPQLKKPPPKVKNPEEEVRSDLLKAIRDGIALKKVEAKEAQENGKGQGLSDVATILARRVAVEFSDSDDCPSDSEYDSDDWGETDA